MKINARYLVAVAILAAVLTGADRVGLKVQVTPAITTLAVGSTQQFTATVLYDDGTTEDMTSQSVWSSSTATVAKIDIKGMAMAVNPGTAVITAQFGGRQGSASLAVSADGSPVLMNIRVTPPYPSVAVGDTQALVAVGRYSDGASVNVTNQAVWSSGTPTVATVDATSGVVTGISAGTANITATYQGQSDTRQLEVKSAATKTVLSISITAPSPTIPVGGKEQLTVTATYKGMTTTDVTSQAIWAASNANATVSLKGMVTGVNRGIDTIYATFGGQTESVTISIE